MFVFVILKEESINLKFFVFVFRFLVATLVRLKNMILASWVFIFWVSDLGPFVELRLQANFFF